MTEHTTWVFFLILFWCDYAQLDARTLPSTVFASHERGILTSNCKPLICCCDCTHHAGLHCMLTLARILGKSTPLSFLHVFCSTNDVLHMNHITVPALPNSDHLLLVVLGSVQLYSWVRMTAFTLTVFYAYHTPISN